MSLVPSKYTTPPVTNDELFVPPLAIPNIPVILEEVNDKAEEVIYPDASDCRTPAPYPVFLMADVNVAVPPTPTLPEREDIPDIPRVAPDILLVTDNESSTEAEETVKDWEIPTFPATLNDDPIPTKPEKYPVPKTSRVY